MAKCDLDKERKFLIWSVATLVFCGGFRIHELLSRERLSVDPTYTLLGKDVVLNEKERNPHLQILLKTQKMKESGKMKWWKFLAQTISFVQSKLTRNIRNMLQRSHSVQ